MEGGNETQIHTDGVGWTWMGNLPCPLLAKKGCELAVTAQLTDLSEEPVKTGMSVEMVTRRVEPGAFRYYANAKIKLWI